MTTTGVTRALVARLDSLGDMVVCGPALRAVAASADHVTVLAGPRGAEAAALLPGVDDVIEWDCPWIAAPPAPSVSQKEIDALVDRLRAGAFDEALVLTSFHQSALPTALVLRMAGVPRIAAVSEDYPGDLLTARIAAPGDAPEPVRMLEIARTAGYELPPGDDGRLRLRARPPAVDLPGAFVAVHVGTGAAARALPVPQWCGIVAGLTGAGWPVVLTGGPHERAEVARVAAAGGGGSVVDLSGRLDVGGLAGVLERASVCVAANTGPAHVAAAVGTPVVSLFAPVVPAVRWAPYGVPVELLGDQAAPCAGTRATRCPIPGHPCLTGITPAQVAAAVARLAPRSARPVEVPA